MPIDLFGLDGVVLVVARGMILTAGAFAWALLLVRIVGLRSFSKMTSFDFVATVATASLIAQAATRSNWPEYAQALTCIGAVFLLQWLLARARLLSATMTSLLRNEPRLLMIDGRFCEEAMHATRVSRANMLEKIRSSGATSFDEVRAVVLETTGDMSVIVGDSVDPRLLDGIAGYPADERRARR